MKTSATSVLLLATGSAFLLLPALPSASLQAQARPESQPSGNGTEPTAELTIDPAQIVSPVSPTLYGLMTEEINHSYDGGLYAELVQNRTMRHSWEGFAGWTAVQHGHSHATIAQNAESGPSLALPESLKLTVTDAAAGSEGGVANSGWWGIAVRPGTVYKGAFYAATDTAQPLIARLIADDTGAVLAEATVALHTGDWSLYTYTLATARTLASTPGSRNHLELTLAQPGTVSLQSVSLMPPTYHDRPNGNRPDLMEKMAAMHPRFLRLPGGNYLEGDTLADWYNWKKTVGPIVDRPGHQAPWTYWSTDGLGLLEFLDWTEDLHVEPVLAVYAGYGTQRRRPCSAPGIDLELHTFRMPSTKSNTSPEMSNTKWGAERAKRRPSRGLPAALHRELATKTYLDRSGSYPARYAQFADRAPRKALSAVQAHLHHHAPRTASTPPRSAQTSSDEHYYKSRPQT